jgi:glycosyltransferase involved in cell wall biosynthesis
MIVWIFQTGEPLHIDEKSPRPMRAMNLSNKLVKSGHSVVLWSSAFSHQRKEHRTKKYKNYRVNDNLEIRLIPSCGYKKHIGLMRLIDHLQLAWNLKNLLRKERGIPDIAFIGYPPIETAAVMSSWLKKRGVPMILDVKDLWPSMFVDAFPKLLKPIARVVFQPYFYLARRTMKNVNGLSTMAPGFLKWILKFSDKQQTDNDKVFCLTMPASSLSKNELMIAKKWWKTQGVSVNMPTVLFVGTFNSVFDFNPIFEAAKGLKNCQFVLCGDGDNLSVLKNKMHILDNIFFPGWVDRSKIKVLSDMSIASLAPYKNLDSFIASTPNKIIDSLLLGLPILSPLRGEVAKLIKNNKVGYTYGDNISLKNCIQSLLDDNELQKQMSINAKKLHRAEFEFNKVYDSLVSHLERMAGIN